MTRYFDLCIDLFDFSIRIDDESGASDTHIGTTIHRFLHPNALFLTNRLIFIGNQAKIQIVIIEEFLMGFDAIGAYSDDFHAQLGE